MLDLSILSELSVDNYFYFPKYVHGVRGFVELVSRKPS
jgi:hypothetical protein